MDIVRIYFDRLDAYNLWSSFLYSISLVFNQSERTPYTGEDKKFYFYKTTRRCEFGTSYQLISTCEYTRLWVLSRVLKVISDTSDQVWLLSVLGYWCCTTNRMKMVVLRAFTTTTLHLGWFTIVQKFLKVRRKWKSKELTCFNSL